MSRSAFSLLAVLVGAAAVECDWAPDPAAPQNNYPIDDAPLRLNRTVANGKAYLGGQPGFEFYVLHLFGSNYEMGFAHGLMFKNEITEMQREMWLWLESQIADDLPKDWPAWFADLVVEAGLDVALDALLEADAPYIGQYIEEEFRGLADSTGLDLQNLRRIHLIAELTQGQCTLMLASGKATAAGKTLFMRGFDWNAGCPCRSWPAIIVYHPGTGGAGHAFLNIGWTGWLGAFTAYGSKRIATGMIGIEYPDESFGNQSFTGIPFAYLLRDIAQFDSSRTEALARISAAARTCNLLIGVGDGNDGTFAAVQYSATVANIMYNASEQVPVNSTWHPQIPETLYFAMDFLCPQFDTVLASKLQENYGAMTPQLIIQNISSKVQTGNLHAVVFDLTEDIFYVGFMAPLNSTGLPVNGYERQFAKFDAAALFAEKY